MFTGRSRKYNIFILRQKHRCYSHYEYAHNKQVYIAQKPTINKRNLCNGKTVDASQHLWHKVIFECIVVWLLIALQERLLMMA